MAPATSTLSPDYIAQQKKRLLDLLAELRGDDRDAVEEEDTLQENSLHEPEGSGDGAQKNNLRDNDAALVVHNAERIAQVSRALQKIEDGTYGLSDRSGKPIPKERLDALPDSVVTVEEGELK